MTKMGLGPSVFYIYSRDKEKNSYDRRYIALLRHEEDMNETHALGVFKRECFAMALGEDHKGAKAIYLYADSWRVARAGWEDGETIRIDFRTTQAKRQFWMGEERLGPKRWPLLERRFEASWASLGSEETTTSLAYARIPSYAK